MRILTALLVVASLATLSLALAQTEKEFVASCTVSVIGRDGHPILNTRVSESWNAYSYDLSGGQDARTDNRGQVFFPAQFAKHSVLFWFLRPILTHLNYGGHSSSGTIATIGISEPGLKRNDGDVSGFTCTDHGCIDRPLEFEIKLVGM